jgi:hypothetical protein
VATETEACAKEKPDRLTLDLVMFILVAALALVLGPGIATRLAGCWYLAGRTNDLSHLDPVMGGMFLAAITAAVMLLLIVIMIARAAVKHRRSSRRMKLARLGMIVLMAGLLVSVVAMFFVSPGVEGLSNGFQEWVRENADIAAIRSWAGGLSKVKSGEIAASDWPPAVAKLTPRAVFKQEDDSVRLFWGGGFIGAYGIIAGPSTMPIPKTDRHDRIFELAPGAYIYMANE